jgi:hypothetical protein
MVGERVGVALRARNRYELLEKFGMKANSRFFGRIIIFERPWFMSLSPRAKCSALVHELWHFRTWNKAIRGWMILLLVMIIGWPVAALILAFLIATLASRVFLTSFSFVGIAVMLYTYGTRFLLVHLVWPVESASDEAAVRFFGVGPMVEVLDTFKKKTYRFWSSHPPPDVRIKRVEALAAKYPKPLIDFEELEAELPQEIILV